MPPILAPPAEPAAPPAPAPVSPSAEAAIPPAAPATSAAPTKPEHTVSAEHQGTMHHRAKAASIKSKFAALTKRLTTAAHAHRSVAHVAVREPQPQPQPVFPPGAPVPPPGYFPPGAYPPSPYQQLVYGGPPRPIYGGWGRYPYYP